MVTWFQEVQQMSVNGLRGNMDTAHLTKCSWELQGAKIVWWQTAEFDAQAKCQPCPSLEICPLETLPSNPGQALQVSGLPPPVHTAHKHSPAESVANSSTLCERLLLPGVPGAHLSIQSQATTQSIQVNPKIYTFYCVKSQHSTDSFKPFTDNIHSLAVFFFFY
jgi:hypothetical protein